MSASPCRPRWVSLWNIVFLLLLSLPLMCGWYNTLMFLHLLKSPPGGGWELLQEKKLCSNFHFHSDTSSKDLWLGHRKYHIYNSLCLHDTILIVAGLEDKYISCCVSCWVSLDLPSGCSKRKERRNKVHPSPDSEGIMTAASPDWPNAFLV